MLDELAGNAFDGAVILGGHRPGKTGPDVHLQTGFLVASRRIYAKGVLAWNAFYLGLTVYPGGVVPLHLNMGFNFGV